MNELPQDLADLPRGTESILVVEDDPPMQELVQILLGRLGYNVILAASGCDAMSLFEANPSGIHLVITDIVLTGEMSGLDVARNVRAIRPNTPVCYMTAHEGAAARLEERGEINRCLHKPFSLQQLAQMVRSAIDQASPGAL